MKIFLFTWSILFTLLFACSQNHIEGVNYIDTTKSKDSILELPHNVPDTNSQTIKSRILPPDPHKRIKIQENSFAGYLRHLPLKPPRSEVSYYDGSFKYNDNIYEAVIDLDIGNKNLHQCADAVMRLRAEYLWKQKQYDKIHFNFTNGFRVDYTEWMKGKRVAVKGNSSHWVQTHQPSNTYKSFWNYLETIFTYAGTLSLSKELVSINLHDMQIGDVFIQGGSPGHAVIVVDMAENAITGERLFLLAQSYMPAQEIQILVNPEDEKLSPWYSLNVEHELITPEWTFQKSDLKRFRE